MKTAKVLVLPYDKEWKREFEKIKREIEAATDGLILGIEHVDSTSVEGMSAKLFPLDIDKYIAYKSPCIEELYSVCVLKGNG